MRPIRPAIPLPLSLPPAGWAGVTPLAAHVAPPLLLPVLTRGAASYPPGLAALPCVLTSLRGLRLTQSPLRYRFASPRSLRTPVTVSPHAPRLRSSRLPLADSLCRRSPPRPSCRMVCRPLCRLPLSPAPARLTFCRVASPPLSPTLCALASPSPPCRMGCRLCLRLSVPSLPSLLLPDGLPPLPPTLCALASPSPPAGWAAASASDHLDRLLSVPSPPHPLMPDGMSSSEPRSVRADVIPGSERSAATATRQRGGGARRVDRGRGACPQFGRAAEPARSAARASPGHPPPHSVRALYPRPLSPPAWGGRRPPTSVNPAMTPAGRLGGGVCSPAKRIFVDEPQGQSVHSNAPSKKKRAPIHIGARRIY